ncbi:MAG TPA: MiaB/RimO family radical SAM methylthiotransferase [Acidimicrobiales bacterium]|nr:MiaB/RimO family radical SAM methylthiotransferase [Acidimicrobiales bacterium]
MSVPQQGPGQLEPAEMGTAAPPRRYFVRTFGCQMNEHDSERLAGLLESQGMVAAQGADDADVVIFNTCCIRENADNRLYGNLGQLRAMKQSRPDMQIAVGGCLAQKDGQKVLERAPWVDAVFGTHNVGHAAQLLERARTEGPVVEILESAPTEALEFPSALPVRRELPFAAWVTIQVGCDNRCAFCIVPAVRGKEISRPFAEVVAEVSELAARGTVEVTLLGQNVNSYGRDLAVTARRQPDWRAHAYQTGADWAGADSPRPRPLFADLLRAVSRVEGIDRVRFTSPHPKDLRPETIQAMATEKAVCPHLHLPLQSGSDRVLAMMRRGYTAERYLERLAAARGAIDDLAVTTDIIVGFPGETEDDFERTLAVVAEAEYDSAYTFIFSPRPGTEAAAWPERFVPADVCAERFQRLRQVVERSALRRHQARVGRTEEVLVEGPAKKGGPGVMSGRSRQNKLVHLEGETLRAGAVVEALVVKAAPHFLKAKLVRVVAPARHRNLIPVMAS